MPRLILKTSAWLATGLVVVFLIVDAATGRNLQPVSVIGGFFSIIAIVLWLTIMARWIRRRASARVPKPPKVRTQRAPDPPKPTKERAPSPKLPRAKVPKSAAKTASEPRTAPATRRRSIIVRVAYRELDAPAPSWDPSDKDRGYAFRWSLGANPSVGMRVFVRNADGEESPAVLVGIGSDYDGKLERVSRIASDTEVESAHELRRIDEHKWLDVARLRVDQIGPSDLSVPEGFPDIPPALGDATSEVASEYGRIWWRAYKLAGDLDRPDDARAFRSVAHRWYAIRDRG